MISGLPEQDLPLLDETIVRLPEDMREDLGQRLASDLFAFCYSVLGYRDLTVNCHGPMCVFLDHNPSPYKGCLMPRDHYKTSVGTIGRTMQKVVRNPDERILIANETSTNAERFLSAIRQHAETNKIFRALYSSVIPKDTRKVQWNNQELRFNRNWVGPEPTVDTVGMTGTMTSRHFTHVTFDDPISEDAAKSKAVMQDTINRMSKIQSLMVKPMENTFDLIGTRWAFHDVYSHFRAIKGSKMKWLIRAAIEDGQPIFPELLSLEMLAEIRQDLGEYMFSCLYMNNPRDIANQNFNVNDLRYFQFTDDGQAVVLFDSLGNIVDKWHISQLDITVTVDPAPAETTTSDRNAIVTVGVSPKNQAIVLDVFAERCTPIAVVDHVLTIWQRYHPRVLGVENVAYQKALKYFIQQAAQDLGFSINHEPVKPGGKGKPHIRGLQPVAATGRLYVHPMQHVLRSELFDYPLGKHDDAADALALHLQLWRGQMSPERWKRYLKSEREVLGKLGDYGNVPAHRLLPAAQHQPLKLLTAGSFGEDVRDVDDEPDYQPTSWSEYTLT
jgi:hypothetical protein